MPNWAEGTIKFRGKQKDIMRLVKENMTSPIDEVDVIVREDAFDLHLSLPENNHIGHFYINNTRRAFIESQDIFVGKEVDEDEQAIIEISDFKQAWAVVPENYTDLSKKYNVDIKIFTFEMGMEFTQEVEIIDGVVTKNDSHEYDNYRWDVPFSNLGG